LERLTVKGPDAPRRQHITFLNALITLCEDVSARAAADRKLARDHMQAAGTLGICTDTFYFPRHHRQWLAKYSWYMCPTTIANNSSAAFQLLQTECHQLLCAYWTVPDFQRATVFPLLERANQYLARFWAEVVFVDPWLAPDLCDEQEYVLASLGVLQLACQELLSFELSPPADHGFAELLVAGLAFVNRECAVLAQGVDTLELLDRLHSVQDQAVTFLSLLGVSMPCPTLCSAVVTLWQPCIDLTVVLHDLWARVDDKICTGKQLRFEMRWNGSS
jgi:hypothetical protein